MRLEFGLKARRLHLLLVTGAVLWGYCALQMTPTLDEVGHLPAGICYWQFGTFKLYRVNPPLTRLLAGLPAVCR